MKNLFSDYYRKEMADTAVGRQSADKIHVVHTVAGAQSRSFR